MDRAPFSVENNSWLVWLQWLAITRRLGLLEACARYAPALSWADVGGQPAACIGGAEPAAVGAEPLPEVCWDPGRAPADSAVRSLATQWAWPMPEPDPATTMGLHVRNYLANQEAVADYDRRHGLLELLDVRARNGLVVVLGSGPSLRSALPDVAAARLAGAVVIAVNQVPTYLDPALIDYYVVMSPRADSIWWIRPGFEEVRKFAFVGAPAEVAAGSHRALHWFAHLDGGPVCKDMAERYPEVLLVQAGHTVATPAFWLAAHVPGVRRIALAGFDLSYPEGLARPDQAVDGRERFRLRDFRGELVTTDPPMFQDSVRLALFAAFLQGRRLSEAVYVYNVGGQGLLGSMRIHAADGTDLSIQRGTLAALI